MWISQFHLCGALRKLFNLASLYATIIGFMVRPWSWSQDENPGKWRKHKDGQVVYPKLIHEKVVSLFTYKLHRPRSVDIYLKKFDPSNAKGDQSFALQTSAEKSTHHLEVWSNEKILCCAKNVVAHWTLRSVFGRNFINEITRIINKHCNDDGNEEREYIHPMTFVTVMTAQLFPHTATPTSIHHFSDYSLVCQHVNLTVSFGRCFGEPIQLTPPYETILVL